MKRITGFVATLGIAASSAIGCANADSWPTRPITHVGANFLQTLPHGRRFHGRDRRIMSAPLRKLR
jgi:hypothetical protein